MPQSVEVVAEEPWAVFEWNVEMAPLAEEWDTDWIMLQVSARRKMIHLD